MTDKPSTLVLERAEWVFKEGDPGDSLFLIKSTADSGSSDSAQNIDDDSGLDANSATGTFTWVVVAILGIALVFSIYWFRSKKEKP